MAQTTNTLEIQTVGINGADLGNVSFVISLMDPMLAVSGQPSETVFPAPIPGQTDSSGVYTVQLLPSSIVGRYRIVFGEDDDLAKEFDMPASDTRLSALPDLRE